MAATKITKRHKDNARVQEKSDGRRQLLIIRLDAVDSFSCIFVFFVAAFFAGSHRARAFDPSTTPPNERPTNRPPPLDLLMLRLLDFEVRDFFHAAGVAPSLEFRAQPDLDHPVDQLLA
jgi:hypothetical protein